MKNELLACACAALLPLVACGGSNTTAGDAGPKADAAMMDASAAVDLATAPKDLAVHDQATALDLHEPADMTKPADMARPVDMTKPIDMARPVDMAGFIAVEGCGFSDYVDARTNATLRTITPWDTSLGTKCLHISSGQSVTWDGVPNPSHPLEAHGTGTTPNPITNVATTTFSAAGTFGFDCEVHHTLMHGAIWVDP